MTTLRQIYKINPVARVKTDNNSRDEKRAEPILHIQKAEGCGFKALFDIELAQLQEKDKV